jgi:hypothetical protein
MRAAGMVVVLAVAGAALAVPPANDACAAATPLVVGGTVVGTAADATPDGNCTCAGGPARDVYHTLTTGAAGLYTLSLCGGGGAAWDTVLSLHSACPAGFSTQVACDDDGCAPPGSGFGFPSRLRAWLPAGATYVVRVGAFDQAAGLTAGAYALSVTGPAPAQGACCTGDACSITTRAACAGPGATYLGDRTACLTALNSPQTYADLGGSFPVPDNTAAGLRRSISVPDDFQVADVKVSVSVRHGYLGDLTVRLIHEGASATLLTHVGLTALGSASALGGTYVFSDDAPQTVWLYTQPGQAVATVPSGRLLASDADANAVSLRQAFAGLSAEGDWTLEIVDAQPGYTGTLDGWSVTIDRGTFSPCTPGVGACCRGGASGPTVCQPMLVNDCASSGGAFQGSGVACNLGPGNPVACCRANFDRVGGVDILDIFGFLQAWFAGNATADFNGQGGVDILDVFAFLGAWFAGCQ